MTHDLPATPLKLAVLDIEDLEVLSAHLQDAILKAGDIAFLPKERRLAFVCNRFDWEGALGGERRRRSTGAHFERVLKVQSRDIPKDGEAVLNLLAITFTLGDAPGGTIELAFSGGAGLRLHVECIEAAMNDLGPMWSCEAEPTHA